MRLIDADAFKIEFCEKCNNVSCDTPLTNTDCFTMYMLDNTPTIEAEPVRHGKWIKFNDELSKCSLCNYPAYTRWNQTDYCPNCGAKLDGGVKK